MTWTDLGHIDDIPVRGARLVKMRTGCIGLFRTAENEVFATSNTCPHRGGPLSEGIVHDRKVTCPLHNMVFSLETGEALGPDEARIETYPVRIEAGRVLIDATRAAADHAA